MLKLWIGAAIALAFGVTDAAAAPLETYGRLKNLDDVEISADGSTLAYITHAEGRSQVVAQGLDGAVLQTVDFGAAKVRDILWTDADHVLVEISKTTGIDGMTYVGELFQAISIHVRTGVSVQLPQRAVETIVNILQDDPIGGSFGGKPTIYATLHAGEAYTAQVGRQDLYRVDPDTGVAAMHQMGDSNTRDFLFKSDGTVVARTRYQSETDRWSLQLRQNGRWIEAYGVTAKIDLPSLEGLSLDETAVILNYHDPVSGRDRLASIALADGQVSEPFNPKGDFSTVIDDSRHVVGLTHTDVYREYAFSDPKLAAAWELIRGVFQNRQLTLSSTTPDRAKLVVFVEGSGEPGGYYLIDLTAKKIKKIGGALPDLAASDIAEVRAIKYAAADGLEINGYLTLPNGRPAKALPLIVLPHGGPQARDDAGFDWWAQALASRGYAVLQPNFRGSTGYDLKFVQAGYGEWGGKMQTDLSDGVRVLARQGVIDPRRVCIVGASYGGYAALAGVTLDKGVYRCAVAVAGVSDLGKFLAKESSQGGPEQPNVRYWKRYLGAASPGDPKLAARSPVNFAAQADGPVLLIHGKDDTVVYFDQSTSMRDALKRAGKPVEFVTLAAEDHWLSREATRRQMLTATVTFLERHNPPN